MASGACWADHAKVHDWCRDINRWKGAILKWSARLKSPVAPVPANPLSPHVLALRALASAGGCPYRAPCGCAAPKCNLYGGLATPERCVSCLGLDLTPTPKTP